MTQQYNHMMEQAFADTEINLIVIPRKETNENIISGSKIRYALTQDDWSLIESFVPMTTLVFLKSDEAKHIIEQLKQSEDVIHH